MVQQQIGPRCPKAPECNGTLEVEVTLAAHSDRGTVSLTADRTVINLGAPTVGLEFSLQAVGTCVVCGTSIEVSDFGTATMMGIASMLARQSTLTTALLRQAIDAIDARTRATAIEVTDNTGNSGDLTATGAPAV